MAVSGTDTPQLCPVLISARPDEFTNSRRLVVTETKTWPSWLLGSTVVATLRTLPSTSPAPIILIRAVWLTASFEISRTGTSPTRSNSLRAMMENSASPLPEAGAPTTAEEAEISPATGACTCTVPPSGSVSRASVCPAVTVSPASARISATFRPGRSGRTEVSSFGIRMPETSTMLPKHDFAALSTVTAAPFGPSLGASGSSAARPGCTARQNNPATTGPSQFREKPRPGKLIIGDPVLFFRDYRYQNGGRGAKRQWKLDAMMAGCGGNPGPQGRRRSPRRNRAGTISFPARRLGAVTSPGRCLAAANCQAASRSSGSIITRPGLARDVAVIPGRCCKGADAGSRVAGTAVSVTRGGRGAGISVRRVVPYVALASHGGSCEHGCSDQSSR